MATNMPIGDNALKGAVKMRRQMKTTGSASTLTNRDKGPSESMAVKN